VTAKETLITDSAEEAARILRDGGTVAFPTETVYGLGADATDESAVRKIFEAKGRPADNPLIVHIGDIAMLDSIVEDITDSARSIIEIFFPGPITVVLKKREVIPDIVSAGLGTVGVRIPSNRIAHEFLKLCRVPVAAPSANVSGKPSPTRWEAVKEDLDGRIDCILKGEATEIGLESTVVDCTSEPPVVLRTGSVTLEELRKVIPEIRIWNETSDEIAAKSPGMKHRHYSPNARVVVIESASEFTDASAAYIGMNRPTTEAALQKICGSKEEYARSLFDFFREADRAGIQKIFCEAVDESGIGLAIMDRIRRAAE
jgi:L-threonylcarbamoyladenylate synthase